MSTRKTALTVAMVFITILGMTAVFGGGAGATFANASDQASSDTAADNANENAENDSDDDGHDHSDEPPENNENPDDPPCDADHGHPANNSEECDDDGAGNGNNGNNGNGTDNGNNGNETDNGDDGNETDDPDNGGESDLGTCEQGGAFQNNTVANEAFGTENEEGPISSELHANEEQFQELEPVVHEGSCVVATVDNNA